jgi:hypothetical protein
VTPVLEMVSRSIISDSRSMIDDSQSTIDDSQSTIDGYQSITDDFRSVIDDHKRGSKLWRHSLLTLEASCTIVMLL